MMEVGTQISANKVPKLPKGLNECEEFKKNTNANRKWTKLGMGLGIVIRYVYLKYTNVNELVEICIPELTMERRRSQHT